MSKLIVCNTKTSKTYSQMQQYVADLDKLQLNNNIIFCPSVIYLPLFNNYTLGAQDITAYENSNITGEITGKQLQSLNCKYVIIAHQERRNYLNESTDLIINKIKNALANNLIPIVCIGEKKYQKNNTRIIKKQIIGITSNLTREEIAKIIFAYEPLYMINNESLVDNEHIYSTIKYIKELIFQKYNSKNKVLYGGSVSALNIVTLEKNSNIDGYLIGHNCLNIENLIQIIGKIAS